MKLKEGAYKEIKKEYGKGCLDPIEHWLDLKTTLHSHLNMITHNRNIKTFKSYEAILDYWYQFRKDKYIERIDRQIVLLKIEILILENIIRFTANFSSYRITTQMELEEIYKILSDNKYIKVNSHARENANRIKTKDFVFRLI